MDVNVSTFGAFDESQRELPFIAAYEWPMHIGNLGGNTEFFVPLWWRRLFFIL